MELTGGDKGKRMENLNMGGEVEAGLECQKEDTRSSRPKCCYSYSGEVRSQAVSTVRILDIRSEAPMAFLHYLDRWVGNDMAS